jgi:hypothetical protein
MYVLLYLILVNYNVYVYRKANKELYYYFLTSSFE